MGAVVGIASRILSKGLANAYWQRDWTSLTSGLQYGSWNSWVFARIYIQLDLDKPLVKTIRIGKIKLAVVYEGIGLLCFHCGKFGHRIDRCPSRCPKNITTTTPPVDVSTPEEEEANNFRPWMLVQRRKRQNSNADNRGKAVPQSAKAAGVDANTGKDKLDKEGRLLAT